ncbi:MAG: hypothetical protein AAF296_06600 [Pseudomonadota bacterium]
MNEFRKLIDLLEAIKSETPSANNTNVISWLTSLTKHWGDDSSENFLRRLYAIISGLESDVALRVLPGPDRDALDEDLETISSMFKVRHLNSTAMTWRSNYIRDLKYLNRTLINLAPLYDVSQNIDLADVAEAMNKIQTTVSNAENLTDVDRSVIAGAIELLERSVTSLERGEIQHFRESVYTAAGRLSLSIVDAGEDKQRLRSIKGIADDVLRLAGLIELLDGAGKLIGLRTEALLLTEE